MWSLLPRNLQLLLIVGASVVFARSYEAWSTIWTGNEAGVWSVISAATTAIGTVATILLNVSWRWLWRHVPLIADLTFPDLNGQWKGTLISTWKNPETGQSPPPIETTVTVRQGLFGTNITLVTGESRSHSIRAFLEAHAHERRFRIWYTYGNEPQAQFRHRSAQHEGVAFLDFFPDEDRNRLVGRYFTERKTTGDLDLRRAPVGGVK